MGAPLLSIFDLFPSSPAGDHGSSTVVREKYIHDMTAKGKGSGYVTLKEDYSAVFFPKDAHQPRVLHDTAMPVKKICIKVLI